MQLPRRFRLVLGAVFGVSSLIAVRSSTAAIIFTDNVDTAADLTANWTTNSGTPTVTAAPVTAPSGATTNYVDADGQIVRIGRGFTTTPGATSYKLTWQMYSNSNASSQRYYGQLSSGTAAAPGTGTGQFFRLAANNDAASKYDLLYSNGATQTVATPTAITVGWHQIQLTVTPGAAGVGSVTYQIDGNAAVNTVSSGIVVAPTNVQLGNTVSNGTAGAPDTSAWYDSIKVEQFGPVASAASGPNPSDTSSGADPNATTLTWTPGASNVSKEDIYLGTDPTLTAGGDLVASNQPAGTASYNPGILSAGTTYYWEVVSKNVVGDPTAASIWSFTTAPAPEPGSIVLLSLGAAGLLGRRRRA